MKVTRDETERRLVELCRLLLDDEKSTPQIRDALRVSKSQAHYRLTMAFQLGLVQRRVVPRGASSFYVGKFRSGGSLPLHIWTLTPQGRKLIAC